MSRVSLQTCARCGGYALRLRNGLCLFDYKAQQDDDLTFEHDPPRIVKVEQPAEGPIVITTG